MSIKEYADSMNCTVQEILNKCRELGIKASDKDSFLEDDDIIVLDNAINIISTNTESTFEDNDALDEAVENILGEEINSKPIIKKEKLKKKGNNFSSKDSDYLAEYISGVIQVNKEKIVNMILQTKDKEFITALLKANFIQNHLEEKHINNLEQVLDEEN